MKLAPWKYLMRMLIGYEEFREEGAVLYTEEQEALGEVNRQDPWMEMIAMGPEILDAEIQYHLYPI